MEIKFINEISGSNLVLVMSKKVLTPELKKIDIHGKLAKIIETQPFQAKPGEVLHILGFQDYENLWLIGADQAENYIQIGAQITKALIGIKNINEVCLWAELPEKEILDMVSGIILRNYVFDKYKKFNDDQLVHVEHINIVSKHISDKSIDEKIDSIKFETECVKMARNVINQAPCCIYPESLAQYYKEFLHYFLK